MFDYRGVIKYDLPGRIHPHHRRHNSVVNNTKATEETIDSGMPYQTPSPAAT